MITLWVWDDLFKMTIEQIISSHNFKLVSSSLSQTFAERNSSKRSADALLWHNPNQILSKNDIYGCFRHPYDHFLGMG